MTFVHTFYHVAYDKPYNLFPEFKVDSEIFIGNEFNPFYNYFYSTSDHIEVGVPGGNQTVHYATHLNFLAQATGIKSYPNPQFFFPYINQKFRLYGISGGKYLVFPPLIP